ncbi:MAG: acyl-CoA thioesterase [Myxococcales bacterium]|nr:acyl-CoA thioesterase [Myxococcales bacterium]
MTAPTDTPSSTYLHRVRFYETDAMGIVHHANYLLLMENARIAFLDEHDLPYREYVERGLHFAVTKSQLDYRLPAHFDDRIEVSAWLAWVRGASLRIEYEMRRGPELLVTGATEHALVDVDGRPVRIPREQRENLKKLAAGPLAARV